MKAAADDDPASPNIGFTIRWGALTISLLIVTIVSLGTLVTVVSIKDVDALSVVALALAVLAFAAQLIVSLAQASAGAQQIAQTERVNADTQSLLSEIRATAESLLTNQKDIFTRVLRAALPEVAREISDETVGSSSTGPGIDPEELEARLLRAVDRGLQNLSTTTRRPKVDDETLRNGPLGRLYKHPTPSDNGRYMDILRTLTPEASVRLGRIARNIAARYEDKMPPRQILPISRGGTVPPDIRELAEKELIIIQPTIAEIDSALQRGATSESERFTLRIELSQHGMEVMSLTFGRFR